MNSSVNDTIKNSLNNTESWIGIEDAAEHLGVKPSTVRDWIKKGKGIPAQKIGKQAVLILYLQALITMVLQKIAL